MDNTTRVVCFKGKKVNLGLLSRELDFNRCLTWMNDSEVTRFLLQMPPVLPEREEEWFANLPQRQDDRIFAILLSNGQHIGNTGLHRISWVHRTASTGTVIGEKDCWGKGYGTEAKLLLLHYAFYDLGLEKVVSQAYEFNERSIRYSLKCGYREEGRLRSQIYRDGRRWDMVQLGILKEEFIPVWERHVKGGERG